MICEPEFCPASEVEEIFKAARNDPSQAPFADQLLSEISPQDRKAREDYMFDRATARSAALIAFFRSCPALYAYKLGLGTLRITKSVLLYDAQSPDIGFGGFWVLAPKTWRIEPLKAHKWIESAERRLESARLSIRLSSASGKDSTKERAKSLMLRGAVSRVQLIAEAIRPLEGAFLCIRQEDVPKKGADILNWYSVGSLQEDDYSAIGGRQRKQEGVLEAYQSAFPDGHAGFSWKQVAKRVSEVSGLEFHVDTLRRALGKKAD